ncbi:type IA DNA topoisomerase [Bacteroides xylanisolvens]|uniref:DNA topoisomerase n=1 Tax=Alistipes onderdonkii TaxID=328813 RepID=A0A1Y3R578_9BACT|nr:MULTISPECIES: type IA DNA topoisomerase [Bacteroidales]OUN03940.1 DNA topoisomerase I [Alistipes onderdonkii]QUR42873.1 type IA DNA topoisomerase [Bacteroides xylanisolvens]
MKTIIAEKPSVAREIARIVKATKREVGYLTGNGYNVTWAFGHLVQPALPDGYGIKGFHPDNLPIIPPVFKLIPRQVKTEKGYKPDSDVVAQIKVIAALFRESERIIVATDAGREGELIFRYLYEYIGCATPFERLWISSLTDTAIREGLERLESGNKYDNLYYAAKARSEADWLVGINATQAITVAAGRGTYSLGRVQTPTLAMVCERYWENKRFTPETLWQAHFSTAGETDDGVVKFSSCKKWKEKRPATEAYGTLKEQGRVRITKVERKESVQDTPLLYDLTTLQKEANAKHGFSAEKTLSLAQKLYEAKLITYPRTGSRYIPEDVFTEIPALLLTLKNNPAWSGRLALVGEPTRRSVDAAKVTDHHALLITGMKPKNLLPDEQTLYDMIVGRMLEAFSEKCVKDVTTVVAECGGVEYTVKGATVRQAGWRGVYNEETEDTVLPEWTEGEELFVAACSMTEGKTKPKPLHTEATLLAAMETAGKEIEDEELRQSLKECGIGTPATRAAIIETLFSREYMVRQKKSLVPTEKGLALYSVVKTMRIADVRMTGEWEAALAKIERGEMRDGTFREAIEIYTKQITTELLASDKLFTHKGSECPCPKCKTGRMQFFGKVVRCDNAACGLPVFRVKAGKTLSDAEITELLTKGRTGVIKGFNSKQGKKFSAAVAFDGEFNTVFEFPEGDKTGKSTKRRK